MSATPIELTKDWRRRLRWTPLGLVGGVVAAVLLSLTVAALLGSGSVAVVAVLLGAAAIIAIAAWTAPPQQGSYRQGHVGGTHGGAYGGGWGGEAGCGGGDGGGGC